MLLVICAVFHHLAAIQLREGPQNHGVQVDYSSIFNAFLTIFHHTMFTVYDNYDNFWYGVKYSFLPMIVINEYWFLYFLVFRESTATFRDSQGGTMVSRGEKSAFSRPPPTSLLRGYSTTQGGRGTIYTSNGRDHIYQVCM